jgi:hypothetical protein
LSRHTFEICNPFCLYSIRIWLHSNMAYAMFIMACSSQPVGSQSVTFLSAFLNFISGFLILFKLVRLFGLVGVLHRIQCYRFVCLGRIGLLSRAPPFECRHDDGCEQLRASQLLLKLCIILDYVAFNGMFPHTPRIAILLACVLLIR